MPKSALPSASHLSLTELAKAADVLVAHRRRDMATRAIELLYYFADREQEACEIVSFPAKDPALRRSRA